MKTFSQLLQVLHEWKSKYHTNREGDLIFQNKETFANVILTDNVVHVIERHSTGFGQLPDTIENPDEIWSYWGDEKQRIALRNYIKDNYVVQTKDGRITDAFQVSEKAINNFRKGVIL